MAQPFKYHSSDQGRAQSFNFIRSGLVTHPKKCILESDSQNTTLTAHFIRLHIPKISLFRCHKDKHCWF